MLNEKPNDDFHWKNKLADLEDLPGKVFDKEAAWGKLHERMQGRPRNKKAIWYWAAAACLLLVLVIPWLFLANKREGILVKNNSIQKQAQPASPHLLTKNTKDIPATISSLAVEKTLPDYSVKKNEKIKSLFKNDIAQLKIIQDKKEKPEFIKQEIANSAAAPIDTIISIVANIPEKKKLKVVHINDLGDPVAETPNITRFYERRSLVKFINREVDSRLPSSGNTGFNFFKAKNIPSN